MHDEEGVGRHLVSVKEVVNVGAGERREGRLLRICEPREHVHSAMTDMRCGRLRRACSAVADGQGSG